MLWSWIRRKVSESVLAGFSDAIDQLNGGQEEDDAGRVAGELRLRLAFAPAEPAEKKKGKAG